MSNVNLDAIKERIRNLSAKTVDNGCSEAEADSAIRMVGKILNQYNLSMEEVEVREELCTTLRVVTGSKHRNGAHFAISAIGKFCNAKAWMTREGAGLVYSFFGQEHDLLIAKYLYDVVNNACKTEVQKFKRTPGWINSESRRAASSSFLIGMGGRLAQRITQMAAENKEDFVAAGGSSLLVLKNSIVEAAFADLNMKLRKGGSGGRAQDANAYFQGQAQANNVNLTRAVTAASGNGTLQLR